MAQTLYLMAIIPQWYLVPLSEDQYWDDYRYRSGKTQLMISEVELTQDITEAQLFTGTADDLSTAIMASFTNARLIPLMIITFH